MKSPFADRERERLIEAMLPDVAFDGWSRRALRQAAQHTGIPAGEVEALFPRGVLDMVAAFSEWADRQMLERLEHAAAEPVSLSRRVALALRLRFEVLLPYREAVRRALSVLSMPQNAPLGLHLLYDTVDRIWWGVGDNSTDFSFYTKRASLAAIQAAATLYWLEDHSTDCLDTHAFIDRGLRDLHWFTGLRERVADALGQMPNPLRVLRPTR